MNGRIAKILRKRAEQKNIGAAKEYQYHKKSIFILKPGGQKYCNTWELKNCTRKIYQQLKNKELKK